MPASHAAFRILIVPLIVLQGIFFGNEHRFTSGFGRGKMDDRVVAAFHHAEQPRIIENIAFEKAIIGKDIRFGSLWKGYPLYRRMASYRRISLATWPPIYPAPPMTSTFMQSASASNCIRKRQNGANGIDATNRRAQNPKDRQTKALGHKKSHPRGGWLCRRSELN